MPSWSHFGCFETLGAGQSVPCALGDNLLELELLGIS